MKEKMKREMKPGEKLFSSVQNLTVVFNYVHDSNSISRAGGIKSENVFGRTVRHEIQLFLFQDASKQWLDK